MIYVSVDISISADNISADWGILFTDLTSSDNATSKRSERTISLDMHTIKYYLNEFAYDLKLMYTILKVKHSNSNNPDFSYNIDFLAAHDALLHLGKVLLILNDNFRISEYTTQLWKEERDGNINFYTAMSYLIEIIDAIIDRTKLINASDREEIIERIKNALLIFNRTLWMDNVIADVIVNLEHIIKCPDKHWDDYDCARDPANIPVVAKYEGTNQYGREIYTMYYTNICYTKLSSALVEE